MACERARARFKKKLKHYQTHNGLIVYLDESGFALDMPRTHGYAPKGKRCVGVKDWHAKGRINVIGAMLGKSLLTLSMFNCNIDSEVFHCWVIKDLIPKLKPSSVIVMDNAAFHKRHDIAKHFKFDYIVGCALPYCSYCLQLAFAYSKLRRLAILGRPLYRQGISWNSCLLTLLILIPLSINGHKLKVLGDQPCAVLKIYLQPLFYDLY
ncbi:MAG: transposase [Saezia sp.]